MKFCMNCGAQLQDNMQFCVKCGTRVAVQPEAPAPAVENAVENDLEKTVSTASEVVSEQVEEVEETVVPEPADDSFVAPPSDLESTVSVAATVVSPVVEVAPPVAEPTAPATEPTATAAAPVAPAHELVAPVTPVVENPKKAKKEKKAKKDKGGSGELPSGTVIYRPAKNSISAIVSFVLGIVSVTNLMICPITGLLSIIFSIIALCTLKRTGSSGKGLAISGLILSIISFIIVGLIIFFAVQFINSIEVPSEFENEYSNLFEQAEQIMKSVKDFLENPQNDLIITFSLK